MWYYAVKFSKRSVHMGTNKSEKRSAHVTCSYARVRARIILKICMTSTKYVRKLSFKFEKNPFSGSREIDVLLHSTTHEYYAIVLMSISTHLHVLMY